jgi:hypothetical protein
MSVRPPRQHIDLLESRFKEELEKTLDVLLGWVATANRTATGIALLPTFLLLNLSMVAQVKYPVPRGSQSSALLDLLAALMFFFVLWRFVYQPIRTKVAQIILDDLRQNNGVLSLGTRVKILAYLIVGWFGGIKFLVDAWKVV